VTLLAGLARRAVAPGVLLVLLASCTPGTTVEAPAAAPAPAPAAEAALPTNIAPHGLASFDVRAVGGDQQLAATWRYATTGGFAESLYLEVYRVTNGVATRVAETQVGHTVEPTSYVIPVTTGAWKVRATPRNDVGWGTTRESPVLTVASACPTATVCARVAAAASPAPVRGAAQGFLHGMTDSSGQLRNRASVEPLKPRHWRFSDGLAQSAATQLGVSRMQVLSDFWHGATKGPDGYSRTPWSNWGAWKSFVQSTVRTAKQQGWSPDYWDVWNEPNGTCCFSPSDLATVTVDRWLRTYVVAWQAIKSVDPAAKVSGPGLTWLQWAPGDHAEFDLERFLSYSAARGVVWDAVSWNENSLRPLPGDISPTITNLDRHIAMAKAVMARHPGVVANNRVLVNEYGPSETHFLAGWAVGFFSAFERNGVTKAHRACWTTAECTTQLNGLLTSDAQPRALWWAHRRYADLIGGTRMNVTSTASWQVSGLATRSDGTSTVRVLLGRHWSCNKAVNGWCASNENVPGASLDVKVDWPYGTAPVRVVTTRLPAGTGALAAPLVVGSTVVAPRAGVVTITVPVVNDGDAISIVATRA
jgi:hypothetical protein